MTKRPELWGSGELCAAFGITREALRKWRQRPDFPRPIARLQIGDVWDAAEVRKWHRTRSRRKPRRTPQGRSEP